jgi:hypothetical protein
MLNSIQIDKNKTTSEILYSLKLNGVCFFPNFLAVNFIRDLEEEYDKILSLPTNIVQDHIKNDVLHTKSVNPLSFDFTNFPKLKQLVNNHFFYQISKLYFKFQFVCPSKIFLYTTRGIGAETKKYFLDDKLAFVPHTDETHFLKFFLYLSDVTIKEGPLAVVPGTQKEFKKIRRQWILKNFDHLSRDKISEKYNDLFIPLVGPRGSLTIFDTDVMHKASEIQEGSIRKVIRFDVYSKRENFNALDQKIFLKFLKLKNRLFNVFQ